jgi:hypothetical protein
MLKTHIERRLRVSEKDAQELLADLIVDRNPRDKMVENLVFDLTSGSLQSHEELLKVASYFDVPTKEIVDDVNSLRDVFQARNQIIHEMDVDFTQKNRNRRPRAKTGMIKSTNKIFAVSANLLAAVDRRIANS